MATRRQTPQISLTVSAAETVQAPIDDSLSIAGMAADAKATGDAIADVNAELSALLDTVPSGNGVYVLQATVSSGTTTFSWVSE